MRYRGVNIGSWLLMEGYILGGRNISESILKGEFKNIYGEKELRKFEELFRDNYIQENDFKNISAMGANVVRLPFNCRLIETAPYKYSKDGLEYLKKALNWAGKNNLKVILDLHAAVGAQNCDWHGDSCGSALLWENEPFRKRTYALWQYVASEVKNHPALYAYDVLNEAVIDNKKIHILKEFYRQAVKYIKEVDNKHIIYLEGNNWSQQIDFLEDILDDNVAISIHAYQPLYYTFNLTPFQKYPGKCDGEQWNLAKIHKYLEHYYKFSQKHKVKFYVGEFGVNWRGGYFGEMKYLDDLLKTFDDYGFDYTYWTYKAVANGHFPDGIYQFVPENKYVNRVGPMHGFETYMSHWKKDKKQIVDFWQTKNYTPNIEIIKTLKKHFRGRE